MKDLTKLLKVGDRIYYTVLGHVEVIEINLLLQYPIAVRLISEVDNEVQMFIMNRFTFTKHGKLFEITDADCVLFPSREIRTWDNYKSNQKK